MRTPGKRRHLQSLAACLASLGPGDACPCCGAPLHLAAASGAPRAAAPRPADGSLPAPGPVLPGQVRQLALPAVGTDDAGLLVCGECGCEVAAVAGPFGACGESRVLYPAA